MKYFGEKEHVMKVLVIYDDTGRKSEVITDIIGEKGFADVVVKKRKLEEETGCRKAGTESG